MQNFQKKKRKMQENSMQLIQCNHFRILTQIKYRPYQPRKDRSEQRLLRKKIHCWKFFNMTTTTTTKKPTPPDTELWGRRGGSARPQKMVSSDHLGDDAFFPKMSRGIKYLTPNFLQKSSYHFLNSFGIREVIALQSLSQCRELVLLTARM